MMGVVTSEQRSAISRWRGRGPSRSARVCWSLILLGGYAGWTWVIRGWAAERGHQFLWAGYRPWYFAVAALTYWPVACLLWRGMFARAGGLVPWTRGDST